MEHRYRALRTIGAIYRVLGYIVLVLAILAFLAICGLSVVGGTAASSILNRYGDVSSVIGGILLSLLALLYGGITAISLIAFGEGIELLIDLEENTRKTAMMLENQNKPPLAQAG
jgi:hypothetical protein